MSETHGYRLRIELQEIQPPIWRTVCVPGDLTLGELHILIQLAMGWYNYHLHHFMHKGKIIGEPDPEFEMIDEKDVYVSDIFKKKGSSIQYEYDFGDSWRHEIRFIERMKKGDRLFQVIDGARACPPEDCGGVMGYYELLEAFSDEESPEYEELMDWLGEDFDPDTFDLEEANRRVQKGVKN